MKTKNFILPAIALLMGTLLNAPLLAQDLDYHDKEAQTIGDSVRAAIAHDVKKLAAQQEYLNISLLRAQINEDIPVNLEELKKITQKSISENKISAFEQYNLMELCITTQHNNILRTLIEAGFNPEIDTELGVTSLAAKAVEYNNVEAFSLTFSFNNKEKTVKVTDELEKMNPSLINRFFEFVKKCETTKTLKKEMPIEKKEIKKAEKKSKIYGEYKYRIDRKPTVAVSGGAHVSKPLLKEPIMVENEDGEQIGIIYSDPRTNITVIDYSGNALSVASESAMRMTPKSLLPDAIKKELEKKGYTIDTVPAATATIKVISDTVPERDQEEGIIGAAYHNQNGTLVIKKFDKPLTDEEYQKWLQDNETMTTVNPTVRVLDLIRKK